MARNSNNKTMIRVIKKENPFVTIDKTCLKDDRLSWKAKGLLCYLLSLPDDWDIYVSELINHASDGRDSTAAGLRELIKYGYAVREQDRDEEGKIRGYIYQIFEIPIEVEEETKEMPEKKSKAKDIENTDFEPETENPFSVDYDTVQPETENPFTDKPFTGKPITENPKLLNNNYTNNDYTNNDLTNLSINPDGGTDEKEYNRSNLLEEIKKEKSIPLGFCKDKEKMEQTINLITETEVYSDELKREALALFNICITEMTTQKSMEYYNQQKLSYKHILQKINDNLEIHEDYIKFKMNLVDEILDDYIDGALKTNVKNHKKYLKSCIVNGFDSHKVKFLSNVAKIAK